MKNLFVFFYILIMTNAMDVKSQNPDFAILQGKWFSKEQNKAIGENWEFKDSTQMDGKAYKLINGEIIETEILMLKKIGNNWCYLAFPKDQLPVLFNYNTNLSTSTHWVFSNVEHDFPKHIAYNFTDINNLEVLIYDSNTVDKGIKFQFERRY